MQTRQIRSRGQRVGVVGAVAVLVFMLAACQTSRPSAQRVHHAGDPVDQTDIAQADNYQQFLPGYLDLSPNQLQMQAGPGQATATVVGAFSAARQQRIQALLAALNQENPQLDPVQAVFPGPVDASATTPFPGPNWVLKNHQRVAAQMQEIYEFVAPGETVDDWSRILTCTRRIVPADIDLTSMATLMRAQLVQSNPDLRWWAQLENGALYYEWSHGFGNNQPAQHVVGRVVAKGTMLYMYSCAQKTVTLDPADKDEFVRLITTATWLDLPN
jgi:hypothetical protein